MMLEIEMKRLKEAQAGRSMAQVFGVRYPPHSFTKP